MLRKVLAYCVTLALLHSLMIHAADASSFNNTQPRTMLTRLGTGPNKQIEVQLIDKTKLKGYPVEISEDSFVLADRSNHQLTVIDYTDIHKVKGYNLSRGQKIALGVGIASGAAFLIFWLWLENAD